MGKGSGISEEKVRMVFAAAIILFFAYIIGSVLWGFIGALFISVFAFITLNPIYKWLRLRNIGKTPSALLAMLIGLIVIGIPLMIICGVLFNETLSMLNQANLNQYASAISNNVSVISKNIPNFTSDDELKKEIGAAVYSIVNYFKDVVIGSMQNIGELMIQLLVSVFVLYYLLVAEEKLASISRSMVPFSSKNTGILAAEFKKITYSALITVALMGLLQALPLTLVFIYFGVPGAVFWGFVALIMTCVPFVGIPVVWIPIALVEAAQHNNDAFVGIVVAGIILAIVENVRPIAQKMIGKVHPLISILGIIVGLSYFGVFGIIIGPLILSYCVLMLKMFKEEYL
ncbi:MAG: AI-2E family transporter [Candidatus Micrarchaeia archaeon]